MALSTSNSNPGWKSYTETNDENDIIRASDFDNEFSIKVDQDSGYSLNQNLVACSIDNTSTLRGLKSNVNINDLVNFYLNYNPTNGSWAPTVKITSTLQANTSYTSSGTYLLTNNILYYWGVIDITDVGVVTGIVSNGTMDFTETYSTSNVSANGVTSTGGTGSGAIFNITSKNVYKVSNTTINSVGQGYSINDVLSVPNASTIVVTSVTVAGTIVDETYTLDTTPRDYNFAGTLSGTGGTGTGAQFTVSSTSETLYTPASITLNSSGGNYAVGDTINLVNIGVVTVSSIDSTGGITEITSTLSTVEQTTDMAGSAVSGQTSGSGTNATFTVTSKNGTYYTPTSIIMIASGQNYVAGDILTITSPAGDTISTVYIKSVTVSGQIQTYSSTNNQSYQTVDVSGNNLNATGGTGSGATFNVTTNQFYTYDKIIVSNGGQNYVVGDKLTIGTNYGTFTVTSISSSDGSIVISGLPYEPISNTMFNVDITYFNGSTNTLYAGIENTNINLYSDQKNTTYSTSNLLSSFQLNISGWFPINNS